jgi:hypothetical protein
VKAHARDDSAGARASETDAVTRALGEFEASLEGLRPSTKRLYLAGAKALLRAGFPGPAGPRGVGSYAELWARTRDVKPTKPARARPFLHFLQSRQTPVLPEDLEGIRARVLEALDRANRLKNPSLTARRDAALLTALCAAPGPGGAPLSRAAPHHALRRLIGVGEGGLIGVKIRKVATNFECR